MEKRVEVNAEELSRIKKLINEAESLLEKRKLKASVEKLYEAAKEAIILLARKYNLDEVKEAEKRGEWNFELLDDAVDKLSDIIGEEVMISWDAVDFLQLAIQDRFLNKRTIKDNLPYIKKLVELAEKSIIGKQ